MNEFWLIFGMMVVTFGVRYSSLVLAGRLPMRDEVVRGLRFVPVTVLTAIVVPYVLYRDEGFTLSPTNPYLLAGLVAVGISYFTKNLLLTIGVGLAVFFGLQVLL